LCLAKCVLYFIFNIVHKQNGMSTTNFHTSGLISLGHKIQPQVKLTCLGRFHKSGRCANWCARRSVCFCWQMETAVFVCLRSNC